MNAKEALRLEQALSRTCGYCGAALDPTDGRLRYCSIRCRKRANGQAADSKACVRCGQTFTPTSRHRNYCSEECRAVGNVRRHTLHPDYEYAKVETWKGYVYKLAGGQCADCGTREGELHAHHIVPQSRGGKHTIRNGVLLCKPCHEARHFPVDGDLVERIARRVVELLRAPN